MPLFSDSLKHDSMVLMRHPEPGAAQDALALNGGKSVVCTT
jgi:hypothetical protein